MNIPSKQFIDELYQKLFEPDQINSIEANSKFIKVKKPKKEKK